jgi:hypothetical protein
MSRQQRRAPTNKQNRLEVEVREQPRRGNFRNGCRVWIWRGEADDAPLSDVKTVVVAAAV